jgi:NADH dehydrogenase
MLGEVVAIDRVRREVVLEDDDRISFDDLIVAPGSRHSYFGHPHWEGCAPGLKTLMEAVQIRERLLLSFEDAERLGPGPQTQKFLTFAIVGGGPTGVELAGAVAEIGRKMILPDFRSLRVEDFKVVLLEAGARLLAGFHPSLAQRAQRVLEELGIDVRLNTVVTDVTEQGVVAGSAFLETVNVIWAAGNETSPVVRSLHVPLDSQGRVMVEPDLSIPGDPSVFVIGDAARVLDHEGRPLPGLAPVAMQQGRYVADLLSHGSRARPLRPFMYKDRGKMATVGKARAVVEFGRFRFSGVMAWLLWAGVHIFFLIGFRNRFRVMFEWVWYYVTQQPGARLIFRGRVERKSDLSAMPPR